MARPAPVDGGGSEGGSLDGAEDPPDDAGTGPVEGGLVDGGVDGGSPRGGSFVGLAARVWQAAPYPDGDVLVSGWIPNPADPTAVSGDMSEVLVARLGPDGNARWARYSDNGEDTSTRLTQTAVLSDGTAILAGAYHGGPLVPAMAAFSSDGTPRWAQRWPQWDTGDLRAVVAQGAQAIGVGSYQWTYTFGCCTDVAVSAGIVVRTDASGATLAATAIGDLSPAATGPDERDTYLYGVGTFGDGTIAVGEWRRTEGREDAFDAVVARILPNGDVAWAKAFTAGQFERAYVVAEVAGRIVVAGAQTQLGICYGWWVAVLDADGNVLRSILLNPGSALAEVSRPAAIVPRGGERFTIIGTMVGSVTWTTDLSLGAGVVTAPLSGEPAATAEYCPVGGNRVASSAWSTTGTSFVQAGQVNTPFGGCSEGFLLETVEGTTSCVGSSGSVVVADLAVTELEVPATSLGAATAEPLPLAFAPITMRPALPLCDRM